MHYVKQQAKFDKRKWEESEAAGKDLCGSYEFCGYCDKTMVNPCPRAAYKYKRANTIKAAALANCKKKAR